VQCLAAPSIEAARPRQGVGDERLVIFGDRRQADDLPVFLRHHMPYQIVLVQPMHDQHDGACPHVVQSAVERVVEPLVRGSPVGFRQRLLGL
jgi:hypothetical protein